MPRRNVLLGLVGGGFALVLGVLALTALALVLVAVGFVVRVMFLLGTTYHRCPLPPLPDGAPSVRAWEEASVASAGVTVDVWTSHGKQRTFFDEALCDEVTVQWDGSAVVVSGRGDTVVFPAE